ncbi:MAG: hypothetical protein ACJ75L_06555 [Gaiellaceae bacterium]
MMDREQAERRARRLLRWYPKTWRVRYGEEFTQLLIADIRERPRSWSRTLDVARRGLAARVAPRPAVAGLVVVATLLVCLWIATYTAPPVACGTHCTPQIVAHLRQDRQWRVKMLSDSNWAIPLAIGVGGAGAALTLLIYRQRRIRR